MGADEDLIGAPDGMGGVGDNPKGNGAVHFAALGLIGGQACSGSSDCAGRSCVDGYCCNDVCDGPCATCNAPGLEGTCSAAPRGSAPTATCGGHLCDGDLQGCSKLSSGDSECALDHYCRDASICLPKADDGEACVGESSCLSGHCVGGICCGQACNDGCGSCALAKLEGQCGPLEAGHPGAPSCAPYFCGGLGTTCPTSCNTHLECGLGHHCADRSCQLDSSQGDACSDDDTCATTHCTDGVCCVAESCGAYRCGAIGACETACSSSAQCSNGHSCNSAGKCEPNTSASTDESGACGIGASAPPLRTSQHWLLGLGLFACLGARRRSRPTIQTRR